MNKLCALILLAVSLSGCATAHDYCVANAEHYASYDQCYGERMAKKQALSNAFKTFGDGVSGRQSVSCTSYNQGYVTQTYCR